jgi:hypothetical protein
MATLKRRERHTPQFVVANCNELACGMHLQFAFQPMDFGGTPDIQGNGGMAPDRLFHLMK